jgi:predicted N-acetyltransferase YhbS
LPDLDYLAVHPDHKGKGIGTLLVQHGVEVAERLGLGAFVLAFEAGLGIYKRTGFNLLRELTLNDAAYGGKGDFTRYYLERESTRTKSQDVAKIEPGN